MEKEKKQIRVCDYHLMSCDERDKNSFTEEFFKDQSVTFIEYFHFLLNGGFDELENELLAHFSLKRWCKMTNDDIVNSVLPKTNKDRIKKISNKDYYIANGYCALATLKRIFTQKLYDLLKNQPAIYYHIYYQMLKSMLFDLESLKIQYSNNLKKDYTYSSYSGAIHTLRLHNVLRQTLYGHYSYHSFSDLEISESVAVIRQMIELRIRRAFGIIAYSDKDGDIHPLNMSFIFPVLKKHINDIEFSVDLNCVERIYCWGNLYMHSGIEDWSWLPYFLEDYLKPLTLGVQHSDGAWDCNNGIVVSSIVISKIQQEIKNLKNDSGIDFDVITCDPQCEVRD